MPNQIFPMLKLSFKNLAAIGLLGTFSWSSSCYADALSQSQQQVEQTHQQDAHAQVRLDKLDEQTRTDLASYQQNQRQADLLEAYNEQLSRMIDSQNKEKQRIHHQLDSLNETEQTALPMLVKLYQQLKTFVANDQPFLPQERQQRLARLQKVLDRADVSLAEKYRQVLDAYQVEIGYAGSIGSYQGMLNNNGQQTQVRFFRLGRTALYYQTLDGESSALWEPSSKSWKALSGSQNQQLSQAIAMANKQKVPQLLHLPLPKTEEPHS